MILIANSHGRLSHDSWSRRSVVGGLVVCHGLIEPRTFLAIADRAGLAEVADEASQRLHRVGAALAER